MTIPSGADFIWPFNLDLGQNVQLRWATAQPLTAVDDGKVRTVFFAETDGVPAQFAFATNGPEVEALTGRLVRDGNATLIRDIAPSLEVAIQIAQTDGRILQIVLLDKKDSLALWKGSLAGRDRVFLTRAGLVLDGDKLRLTSSNSAYLNVGIYPAPASLAAGSGDLAAKTEGVFHRFAPPVPHVVKYKAKVEQTQAAGPLREIPLGKIERPVATAPLDADFEQAAVWHVKIPKDVALDTDPILRLHYVGDVARVLLNGKFITDDFYNGNAFDIGLRRHAPDILQGDLRVAILPLQKDAPIYMAAQARPDFSKAASVAALESVEIIPRYQVQLMAR